MSCYLLKHGVTASLLNCARVRVEGEPGLTDFDSGLLGGESEVGALSVGTYWFARGVNEITLHPRPASLPLAGNVETDHPHEWPALVTPPEGRAHCGGWSHHTLLS